MILSLEHVGQACSAEGRHSSVDEIELIKISVIKRMEVSP